MTLPQSGKTWARDAETWEEEKKLQKELHGSSGWVPTSTHLTRLPRVFTVSGAQSLQLSQLDRAEWIGIFKLW